MSQPFGKRNLPDVRKLERAKLHKRSQQPRSPPSKTRFHVYIAVSILVLVLAGYALAY